MDLPGCLTKLSSDLDFCLFLFLLSLLPLFCYWLPDCLAWFVGLVVCVFLCSTHSSSFGVPAAKMWNKKERVFVFNRNKPQLLFCYIEIFLSSPLLLKWIWGHIWSYCCWQFFFFLRTSVSKHIIIPLFCFVCCVASFVLVAVCRLRCTLQFSCLERFTASAGCIRLCSGSSAEAAIQTTTQMEMSAKKTKQNRKQPKPSLLFKLQERYANSTFLLQFLLDIFA